MEHTKLEHNAPFSPYLSRADCPALLGSELAPEARGFGDYPLTGCRSVIGPFPRLLWISGQNPRFDHLDSATPNQIE